MNPATHILAAFAALAMLAPTAHAQDRYGDETEAQEARPPIIRSTLLIELSETIGGAHYLRVVCEGEDQQYWRDRMIELLELEAAERYRLRDAMIEAFNDGYRIQERRQPQCDSGVKPAERRLAATGAELARQLGDPYL